MAIGCKILAILPRLAYSSFKWDVGASCRFTKRKIKHQIILFSENQKNDPFDMSKDVKLQ